MTTNLDTQATAFSKGFTNTSNTFLVDPDTGQPYDTGHPVPVSASVTPPSAVVSTLNSTTTLLAANAVYTGTSESSLAYGSISVQAFADQASAASGLVVRQSQDGTNWDTTNSYSILASTAFQQTINLVGQFFEIRYTNGTTNQGVFRLQVIKEVGISPAAGVSNQRVSAQSGDFATGALADGAITTLGLEADANTVNTVMGRLTKMRDLLLGFVFDNTDRLKTSLYVKTSAAADTILTLGRTNKAGSLPVTMASDQDAISTTDTNSAAMKTDLDTVAGAVTSNKMAAKAASGDFADGALATIGLKADTAITDSTTTNTAMSFWKGFVKILNDVWDSTNHRLHVNVDNNTTLGQAAMASSLPVVVASDQSSVPMNLKQINSAALSVTNPNIMALFTTIASRNAQAYSVALQKSAVATGYSALSIFNPSGSGKTAYVSVLKADESSSNYHKLYYVTTDPNYNGTNKGSLTPTNLSLGGVASAMSVTYSNTGAETDPPGAGSPVLIDILGQVGVYMQHFLDVGSGFEIKCPAGYGVLIYVNTATNNWLAGAKWFEI